MRIVRPGCSFVDACSKKAVWGAGVCDYEFCPQRQQAAQAKEVDISIHRRSDRIQVTAVAARADSPPPR